MAQHSQQPLDERRQPGNPFSTGCVRPGALDFIFPHDQSPSDLIAKLRSNRWWGQITGPHGSGKSALLATLLPALREAGRQPLLIQLRDNQRWLPGEFRQVRQGDDSTLVIVDGYEQLNFFSRAKLRWVCRRRGLGLVVTTHRPAGFPHLFTTEPCVELACRIVERLLQDEPSAISPDEVAAAFVTSDSNIREMLFALYDLYERREKPARE